MTRVDDAEEMRVTRQRPHVSLVKNHISPPRLSQDPLSFELGKSMAEEKEEKKKNPKASDAKSKSKSKSKRRSRSLRVRCCCERPAFRTVL